jgi:hypothetical protein
MMQQRLFTKEFGGKVVRLALTIGRAHREIAGDLGAGTTNLDQA